MLSVILVAVTVQILLGGAVSGIATYPSKPVRIDSVGGLISAISSAGGPALLLHATLGVLIFVMGIGVAFSSLRYHKRSVTIMAALDLVTISLALAGGFLWASSDFSNTGAVTLMGSMATIAYAFLFLTLYFTK
jgi:hypothetical protein